MFSIFPCFPLGSSLRSSPAYAFSILRFFFYDQHLFPQLDQPQSSQPKLVSSAVTSITQRCLGWSEVRRSGLVCTRPPVLRELREGTRVLLGCKPVTKRAHEEAPSPSITVIDSVLDWMVVFVFI